MFINRGRRFVRVTLQLRLEYNHLRVCKQFFSDGTETPPLGARATGKGEKRWVLEPGQQSSSDGIDDSWIQKDFTDKEKKEFNRRLRSDSKTSHSSSNPNIPLASVRGFLELNPHVCSGCGTQFQSKSPDAPGYLHKDKLVEHRVKAERIKQQQDALKLLDMVSINVESELAYKVLKEGNVPDDIIQDVIELGRQMNRHIPKDIFGDGEVSGDHTHANTASPMEGQAPKSAATRPPAPTRPDEEPLGYHPDTLDPIYDLDELRLSYQAQDTDPRLKYSKFDRDKKRDRSSTSSRALPGPAMEDTEECGSGEGTEVVNGAIPVCQRCFRLQMYGECDDALRPGWSSHELLTPTRFQELLTGIKETKSVVLCLVDLFDIEGSIVPNLKEIAGKNPIVIVANKVDLLPKDASMSRVNDWVHSLLRKKCGLLSPKEAKEADAKLYEEQGWYPSRKNSEEGMLRRSNVHLVSCEKGTGLPELVSTVVGLAKEHGEKVHVMGTANVGKSSFINRLLRYSKKQKGKAMQSRKKLAVPQATVSRLPGTTLDFLKIKLPNGLTVIDTPGLINPGQVTSKLNSAELKMVIPNKRVNHVSLRVEEGRCVLIGGLAKFELVQVWVQF